MAKDETEVAQQVTQENEQIAAQKAKEKARMARWDLDIAVFLFAVLIIVIILLFQEVGIEIVAPVAIVGLILVWLAGWRRGENLYQRLYNEELAKLDRDLKKTIIEETIEERVQKALRERGKQP